MRKERTYEDLREPHKATSFEDSGEFKERRPTPAMSMPTKGKHHHLPHHHHSHQPHHNPSQHQPHLLVNVNQPSVHSPQAYSTVVTANAPRFVPNAVVQNTNKRVTSRGKVKANRLYARMHKAARHLTLKYRGAAPTAFIRVEGSAVSTSITHAQGFALCSLAAHAAVPSTRCGFGV